MEVWLFFYGRGEVNVKGCVKYASLAVVRSFYVYGVGRRSFSSMAELISVVPGQCPRLCGW